MGRKTGYANPKKAPFSGREGCDLDKTGEFLSFTLYDKYIKNKTLLLFKVVYSIPLLPLH